jgi:hypothetical protein
VKITLGEIKLAEPALFKLVEKDLKVSLAFKLGKLVRLLNQELQAIEEARRKLVKKYGAEDPETKNVTVNPDQMMEFNKEWIELMGTEIDFKFDLISLSDLDDSIELTALEANNLALFFRDEE